MTSALPIFDVVLNAKTVRGSIVGTRKDLQEALAFAGEGKVHTVYSEDRIENINADPRPHAQRRDRRAESCCVSQTNRSGARHPGGPLHQKPRTFHQTLPTTAKISRFTTHITKPTRHQVPIVTKPLPKMIGEVPVA